MSDPTAIYIHIPFCVQKCDYCNFYSDTDISLIPVYVQTLLKEIEAASCTDYISGKTIETIYFGGGTPSVLSVQQTEQILLSVQKNFSLSPYLEVSFEVNPGTIDKVKLKDCFSLGINRLSVGVQSFNNEKLLFLNRIHTAGQAIDTVENARKAGFKNIGLDLIYGLPFESNDLWQDDLNYALKLDVSHLSCYMLTIESQTPLYDQVEKGSITPLTSEKQSDMFQQTALFLTHNGYEHYEISNFAKGMRNRSCHNSIYWQLKPYRGFGAAAHSFDGKNRFWNHSDIKKYIYDIQSNRLSIEDKEELTQQQRMIETIMLGLRTSDGINIFDFDQAFQVSFRSMFKKVIDNICDNRLRSLQNERFVLNLDGRMRLNNIVEAFVELS